MKGVPAIPWLRPRDWKEQALGEMIAGSAIEFQHALADEDEMRSEYWSGYWAALIDYGRRIFNVKTYYGPGGERAYKMGGQDDDEASTTAEDDGAPAVPEEAVSRL